MLPLAVFALEIRLLPIAILSTENQAVAFSDLRFYVLLIVILFVVLV